MNRIYRKISCAFALAAIVAGCSDKPLDEVKSYPLTFSVQLADDTKAAGLFTRDTLGSLTSFKVYGYNGNTRVLNKKTVSKKGNTWIISDVSTNWESGVTMTFFAYANMPSYAAVRSSSSSAKAYLDIYEIPDNASEQWDPLIGYYKGTGDEGRAPITFRHPLTAVSFKTGDLGDSKYNLSGITSVTLKNVHKSDTATTTDGINYTWSPTFKKDVTGIFSGTSSTVPFLLIPQNLATNNVELEITVSRSSGGPKTMYATLNTGSWAAGTLNTYTLNYVNDKMEAVLTVTLMDWGTVNNENGTPSDTSDDKDHFDAIFD